MTIGQFLNTDSGRGGVMCSTPIRGDIVGASITLSHAMDRAPDLMFLRLTNIVTDTGWTPGQSLHYYQSTSASGFAIQAIPGKVVANFQGNTLANVPIISTTGSAAGIISAASWKVELVCVWLAPLLPSL